MNAASFTAADKAAVTGSGFETLAVTGVPLFQRNWSRQFIFSSELTSRAKALDHLLRSGFSKSKELEQQTASTTKVNPCHPKVEKARSKDPGTLICMNPGPSSKFRRIYRPAPAAFAAFPINTAIFSSKLSMPVPVSTLLSTAGWRAPSACITRIRVAACDFFTM